MAALAARSSDSIDTVRVALSWRTPVRVHDLSICLLDVADLPVPLGGQVVMHLPRVRLRIERDAETRIVFVTEETIALGYLFRLSHEAQTLVLDVGLARLAS